MATKPPQAAAPPKPPKPDKDKGKAPQKKTADVDALLAKIPAGKKPPKATATAALAALEVIVGGVGESVEQILKRRGLKAR